MWQAKRKSERKWTDAEEQDIDRIIANMYSLQVKSLVKAQAKKGKTISGKSLASGQEWEIRWAT